jgi:hypothetical protein
MKVLTIRDIRRLFKTSADADVVRDCVRAIGVGVAGVFEHEVTDPQRRAAAERLVARQARPAQCEDV